jgi:hypothetical protein
MTLNQSALWMMSEATRHEYLSTLLASRRSTGLFIFLFVGAVLGAGFDFVSKEELAVYTGMLAMAGIGVNLHAA